MVDVASRRRQTIAKSTETAVVNEMSFPLNVPSKGNFRRYCCSNDGVIGFLSIDGRHSNKPPNPTMQLISETEVAGGRAVADLVFVVVEVR
jgi:hypothetical protein